jgi:hypothetical protein
VAAANVTGRSGAVEMLGKCAPNLSKVAKVLCDGGCSGKNFADAVTALPARKPERLNAMSLIHLRHSPGDRWLSARLGGWKSFRRLWKNCERKIHSTLQMMVLAFISLLLKRY